MDPEVWISYNFTCHKIVFFFVRLFVQLLENANTVFSSWAIGKQVVGWIFGTRAYSLPSPITGAPGKCDASSPCWIKNVCSFLSPSVSVSNEPLRWTAFSPPALPGQRQPPLNQHCLGHWGLESFPCCLSPPTPAFFQPHFCSFYSFAHICLCGKFTAHTACLNYLKAKYSRLCHKAFPFCVFYFSVWGPFMKSAARRQEIICILGSVHLEFLNFRD